MTGIIFRSIAQEKFSILKFYVARANRIIPALAVLCLVLLVFGWFYLTPLDYKNLSKHAASSMGFLSNIIYWSEAGYFDTASHEKWLLHTWSLSAEWQFYIIYPLLLVSMRKFLTLSAMKTTVLLGTALGFIFCIVATYKWPNASYYLLPTRAWEMMLGGVAYLYPFTLKEKRKKTVEWLGLVLIIGSYFLISKEAPWPGYLAIFPVLGAFLIIQAQRNDSLITSNALFQKIGTWSYSIYLWHWPLVVAIYYFSLSEIYIYIGIALSVLLGFLSNKYIENIKFRNDFDNLVEYLKCKPLYISLIVSVIASLSFSKNGFDFHYSEIVLSASKEAQNKRPYEPCIVRSGVCYFKNNEQTSKTKDVDYILFGDSHSLANLTAILASIKADETLLFITSTACLFIPNLTAEYYDISKCTQDVNFLYENAIPNNPGAKLIMVQRTNIYFTGYNENEQENEFKDIRYATAKQTAKELYVNTLCNLAGSNDVFVMRPTPEFPYNIPNSMAKNNLFNRDEDFTLSLNEFNKRNFNTLSLFDEIESCGVKAMDPVEYLCKESGCISSINSRPIYRDDDHLSEFGSKLLTPMFTSSLQ